MALLHEREPRLGLRARSWHVVRYQQEEHSAGARSDGAHSQDHQQDRRLEVKLVLSEGPVSATGSMAAADWGGPA